MKTFSLLLLPVIAVCSCNKTIDAVIDRAAAPVIPAGSVAYTIEAGAHYSNQSSLRRVSLTSQAFTVRFDSSAVYATIDPGNQYDINKLWGFSDNNADHHQFSARFGWRWSDGALRLFGYVYNNGVMAEKELGTAALNTNHQCRIDVKPTHYYFTLNGRTDSMARRATTASAVGYQLYPYFGGNEVAPHKITIHIEER